MYIRTRWNVAMIAFGQVERRAPDEAYADERLRGGPLRAICAVCGMMIDGFRFCLFSLDILT